MMCHYRDCKRKDTFEKDVFPGVTIDLCPIHFDMVD